MATRRKLVVWGGSAVATPELVAALRMVCSHDDAMDVVLVGRTVDKLKLVAGVCSGLAEAAEADLRISYATDLPAATAGADYILNQIRVGGLEARASDESLAYELGFPGDETVGPGGFSNALRTIPVVLEYCRMAEQVAPDALILNLTNPSSYVQYAIRRYTSMSVLGICDTPATLTRLIAQVLDLPHSEMEFDYVGMHHAGWVVAVRHLGEDVLPQLMERADALSALEIDPQVIRAVGAVPSRYFKYYFHRDRMLAKQEKTGARTEELIRIHAEMLAHYAQGNAHMQPDVYTRRGAAWYGMVIIPVLLNLMRDGGERFILNVDNGSTIPWLPCESIVEVPCVVSASGAHPLAVGSVPADIMAFVQANCTYEMLAVQAIVEQSCDLALRALLLNPMVATVGQARRVLDRVWPESQDG